MPSFGRNRVEFELNGEVVAVEEPDPRVSLGEYLRSERGLSGLQLSCRQGGCGACTVLLSGLEGKDGGLDHRSVNSCLVPLCSVDGKKVTTVEGVGSVKAGLHPIQSTIVEYHGTQCGMCTPGMVMSMYGLVRSNSEPTSQQVEDQLDGNLCRCTGYRPILDGFQTLAKGGKNCGPCNQAARCTSTCAKDIEEMGACGDRPTRLVITKDGVTWVRLASLQELYAFLRSAKSKGDKVRIVKGNTASGVYKPPSANFIADISEIPDLTKVSAGESGITIGGAVPIADLMKALEANSELSPSYEPLLNHLKRVAHHQVRNIGSVAGNLAMTHEHGDFTSDVSTILMAAGATLKLGFAHNNGAEQSVGLEEFFNMSLEGVVILEITVPIMPKTTRFLTYKVALRRVNAHALMNAGFKLEVDSKKGLIVGSPVIVYGGVKEYPQRARKTEDFLVGKSFSDRKVYGKALEVLQNELVLESSWDRTAYRSSLLGAFLYKALLSLLPEDAVPAPLRSAIAEYVRPISTGEVNFDKGDPAEYPVSLPIPKLSAGLQATGEAQFMDDIHVGGGLFATYVTSTVASAAIKTINPAKAIALRGVVTFISAATVKADGYCNFVGEYEEVFASSRVQYYGQPLGLIVADSKRVADEAAKLVDVEYTDIQKPILTFDDAIAANSFFSERGIDWKTGSTKLGFQESDVIVEGQVESGHQYHHHLETQRSLCIPGEDNSIEVFSSTQNPSMVQHCVGVGLNRPQHKVTVKVKRIGGAYGSKLNRSACHAMACAFAADKLQKPVRLVLDMATNMQGVGARSPYRCNYKVGVSKDGHIKSLELNILNNHGAHFDFENPDMSSILAFIDNTYNIPHWDINGKIARTNLPACTYMRGPVFVETVFMMETMMEHVASVLQIPADVVREANMYKAGDTTIAGQQLTQCNAKEVFSAVKESSSYESRSQKIKEFNSENKFVKRGISIVPVKFVASWAAQQFIALVNIYPDGSVGIHQSGCEMGQGLDVKVAQVASMSLGSLVDGGLDMANIRINNLTTTVANNVAESGGSVTSELAAMSVQVACDKLVKRLKVTSKMLTTLNKKPSWQELIQSGVDNGIDLQARGRIYPSAGKSGPFQYVSFGAGVTEAEVDVITGDTRILRADILLDCGKSLNPAVDIGQVKYGTLLLFPFFCLWVGYLSLSRKVGSVFFNAAGNQHSYCHFLNSPKLWSIVYCHQQCLANLGHRCKEPSSKD
ncbi:hypothetical protein M758_7G144100 [Ceratodon purpureus]|nr:hypothetical protein M758_7G144100 [Ceratodon purpureus]KAG0611486.1 hypothetical protein M758_7G144100 [Ceratodon purpureus]